MDNEGLKISVVRVVGKGGEISSDNLLSKMLEIK
jgi:hypothetical protein